MASPLSWDQIGSEPTRPGRSNSSGLEAVPSESSLSVDALLNDPRPKVLLAGDNRLLSDVAAELAPHLVDVLFLHNDEVVTLDKVALCLRAVDVQAFRTLVETRAVCYRKRNHRERVVEVGTTMSASDSAGILKASQLKDRLQRVKRVNSVRLPVCRHDGRLELLPNGYDIRTQTLTVPAVSYADDLSFEPALEFIKELYAEFEFAGDQRERERNLAVCIAAGLSLYGSQLVPQGEIRPAFNYSKNAEGAGATIAAACAIVPVIGNMPTGCKPGEDDEVRKVVTTAIREARPVLVLDNVRGRFNSPSLEALQSSPTWNDRILGSNEMVARENLLHVFLTGNQATFTPDWRRRGLFVELHLSAERAEDRVFRRTLSVPVLQSIRGQILAAYWAFVRHWDENGRPDPSRSHSSFPAWARIIGGIVEAAGFGCCLETAPSALIADEDGEGMRALTGEMDPGRGYTPQDLAEICRSLEIFAPMVMESKESMGAQQRSTFGRMLKRYDNRRIGARKFTLDGSGRSRRYYIFDEDSSSDCTGRIGRQGTPDGSRRNREYVNKEEHLVRPYDLDSLAAAEVHASTDVGRVTPTDPLPNGKTNKASHTLAMEGEL